MVAGLAEIALEVVGVGGIHHGNSGGGRTVPAIMADSGLARREGLLTASAATLARRHAGSAAPATAERRRRWRGSWAGRRHRPVRRRPPRRRNSVGTEQGGRVGVS